MHKRCTNRRTDTKVIDPQLLFLSPVKCGKRNLQMGWREQAYVVGLPYTNICEGWQEPSTKDGNSSTTSALP